LGGGYPSGQFPTTRYSDDSYGDGQYPGEYDPEDGEYPGTEYTEDGLLWEDSASAIKSDLGSVFGAPDPDEEPSHVSELFLLNQRYTGPTQRVPRPTSAGPRRLLEGQWDTRKIVIAGVAAVVLVGLIFAIVSIFTWDFSLPGLSDPEVSASSSQAPVDHSNEAAAEDGDDIATPSEPPKVAAAQALDPFGDGNEHPENVGRVLDGDPNTMWSTRYYAQPTPWDKPGIGLGITLEKPALVTSIVLDSDDNGGIVEIMTQVPSQSNADVVLGRGTFTGPTTTIVLDTPTELTSFVVWFPELPVATDGKNRVNIREITVN
jgi:hypothetical protein